MERASSDYDTDLTFLEKGFVEEESWPAAHFQKKVQQGCCTYSSQIHLLEQPHILLEWVPTLAPVPCLVFGQEQPSGSITCECSDGSHKELGKNFQTVQSIRDLYSNHFLLLKEVDGIKNTLLLLVGLQLLPSPRSRAHSSHHESPVPMKLHTIERPSTH